MENGYGPLFDFHFQPSHDGASPNRAAAQWQMGNEQWKMETAFRFTPPLLFPPRCLTMAGCDRGGNLN